MRVSHSSAKKLGINSLLYRKSLGTKNRREAVSLARRYWVKIERQLLFGRNMPIKHSDITLSEYLEIEEKEHQNKLQKSRYIGLALDFTQRYESIPDWDEMTREVLTDH